MDILRMSAAEKAAITARIEASLIDVSDSDEDEDLEASPVHSERLSPEPVQEDITKSKAWMDYLESKRDFDQETEQFYDEWREEVKEMKRVYAPIQILETAHESSSSSSPPPEAFEDLPPADPPLPPSPPALEPEIDLAAESLRSEEAELIQEKYSKEWETNQMTEEDDLSHLIYLHYINLQHQRVEKERKRQEAEHRRSQDIKLKAQLAVIDSEKKRKREEIRLIEEEKRRNDELQAKLLSQDQANEQIERRCMRCEEQRTIAVEEQHRREEEGRETGRMTTEDRYSKALSAFLGRKGTKPLLIKADTTRARPVTITVTLPLAKASVKPAYSQAKTTPIVPPPAFPVPASMSPPECPIPSNSTPLSDSLPYDFSPNLSHFELKCENITHINGLSSLSQLKSLSLTMNQISDIVNIPWRLVVLDLAINKITKLPGVELPALQELVLDSNLVTRMEGCGKCRNLRVLSLQSNQVCSLKGVENFPLLQRLNLYRNTIPDQPDDSFSRNPYLTHLNIGRNKLKSVGFHTSLRLLRSLILYENQIERLSAITASPLLHELWLNGNRLSTIDFLTTAECLEIVRLDQNQIVAIHAFSAVNLREINLSDNAISDIAVIAVVLSAAPSVTTFEFADNPVVARVGEAEWALKAGLERKLGKKSYEMWGNSGKFHRVKYEYTQSELWLRSIARGEIRLETLKEQLRDEVFALAVRHYMGLHAGGGGGGGEVMDFEHTAYVYKQYLYKLRRAARLIQCWWKLRMHRMKQLRLKYAQSLPQILRLQAWFRGLLVRKQAGSLRYPINAVVKIQAWFRGCWLRKRFRKAMEGAKFVDPELAEIQEMRLEEYTDFDFDLKVPAFLDLQQFIQPVEPRFPPISQVPPSETRSSWSRPSTDSLSDTKSAKSSVPQLPSANRDQKVKETLSAWGFQGEDVKKAFNHRLAKKKARKMKEKETTADERLQRFRRMCG